MSDRGLPPEWHGGVYPPGTPRPTSEAMDVTCPSCKADVGVTRTTELGTTYIDPEECPACGEPWPDDILDSARAPERDWDQEREREWERAQDEDDRLEESSYHYPPDFPAEQ